MDKGPKIKLHSDKKKHELNRAAANKQSDIKNLNCNVCNLCILVAELGLRVLSRMNVANASLVSRITFLHRHSILSFHAHLYLLL